MAVDLTKAWITRTAPPVFVRDVAGVVHEGYMHNGIGLTCCFLTFALQGNQVGINVVVMRVSDEKTTCLACLARRE